MGGGRAGRREGVPGLGEAVAVAVRQAHGQLRIGGLVFGGRRRVAQQQRHGHAQQDGEGDDGQQDEAVLFGGHGEGEGGRELCESCELGGGGEATDFADCTDGDAGRRERLPRQRASTMTVSQQQRPTQGTASSRARSARCMACCQPDNATAR